MCTDSFITLPKHTSSPADIVRFPALGILNNPDKKIEKYSNFKRIYSFTCTGNYAKILLPSKQRVMIY